MEAKLSAVESKQHDNITHRSSVWTAFLTLEFEITSIGMENLKDMLDTKKKD